MRYIKFGDTEFQDLLTVLNYVLESEIKHYEEHMSSEEIDRDKNHIYSYASRVKTVIDNSNNHL